MVSELTILDVEQGTDEWLEARRGIITASVIGQLVTPRTIKAATNAGQRALVAEVAAERITGWVADSYAGGDMLRGWEDEPRARDLYAEHYAPVAECGLMIREFGRGARLGYSPDGLVGDDGLIEIKSRLPKRHVATVLANEVPSENMAQIQAGLLASGRKWLDYVSFSGGLALWIKRVYPDPRWFAAITEAVTTAEEAIALMVDGYRQATAGLPMTERITYEEVDLHL